MLDVGPRWKTTRGGKPAAELWDAKTAIRRIRSWEEHEPFWIEEPLPPDDYDGYARLCGAVETAIAAGDPARVLPTPVCRLGERTSTSNTRCLSPVFVTDLVRPRLQPVEGFLRVPEAPGLGAELDEELVRAIRVI
jgi:L-alanine-DL-glutamate epimerase-like enolase superfamily enzyme